eukprot:CAMPEP_0184409528 /NCGR_PEP_ID=MMETSP0738-20130409/4161_1 /TAXON_ID=385413 /ORGANISM="Thalassiosira miniscula, Strain CCMP1093" /LENGTH=124 /DNA_ID=CAMNT_0026767267 /DNA_START=125 /DNA_END=496 /DNA_ORIENTATION=-
MAITILLLFPCNPFLHLPQHPFPHIVKEGVSQRLPCRPSLFGSYTNNLSNKSNASELGTGVDASRKDIQGVRPFILPLLSNDGDEDEADDDDDSDDNASSSSEDNDDDADAKEPLEQYLPIAAR